MTNGWLGVEMRHLVALSAVARESSFRGAADELGYVQSAVSQQISQLERLVGCRLLERTRGMRGCSVTPAGAVLLAHVDKIVARYQAAQTDLAALESTDTAPLRVGMAGSLAERVLPELIVRLRGSAPAVQLVPVEMQCEADLFGLVEQRQVDVAFGVLPLAPGPFAARELVAEPFVLVVQADSPLARATEPPTAVEVANLPLIRVTNGRPETGAEQWLAAGGASTRVTHTAESECVAQALVAGGMGVALLPRFAVNAHDRRTAVVALGESAPARHLAIYWHRDRRAGPALRDFCVAAAAATQRLAGAGDPKPPLVRAA